MTTPHTPCAEAIEAMLNVEYSPTPLARCDEDELHEMRVWMAKRLTAALPHLRRQIVAECVQIVTGRLQMLKSFAARNSDAKLDDTLEETENIRLLLTDLLDAPTKEGDE